MPYQGMTAAQLVADLNARGFTIRRDGDFLRVKPAGALTDVDRAEIRRLKPELLRMLDLFPAELDAPQDRKTPRTDATAAERRALKQRRLAYATLKRSRARSQQIICRRPRFQDAGADWLIPISAASDPADIAAALRQALTPAGCELLAVELLRGDAETGL